MVVQQIPVITLMRAHQEFPSPGPANGMAKK
jgi:hypothetical protein